MAKRVGIIPHLYARPLFDGLLHPRDARESSFEIVNGSTAQLAQKLRQGELDGAFLSPIDYAKQYSSLSIVPSVAVSSKGESRTAVVAFRERLRTIQTLAVDAQSSSEIVLAHLVLAEKHNIAPKIIPVAGSPAMMLEKADAALLIGDTAIDSADTYHTFDLVDEWTDITGMPYVHGLWVAPEDILNISELQNLIDSASEGSKKLGQLADNRYPDYLEQFKYDFDEDAIAAMTEFFRMAYYHGILKDIPDLKFHSLIEEK